MTDNRFENLSEEIEELISQKTEEDLIKERLF